MRWKQFLAWGPRHVKLQPEDDDKNLLKQIKRYEDRKNDVDGEITWNEMWIHKGKVHFDWDRFTYYSSKKKELIKLWNQAGYDRLHRITGKFDLLNEDQSQLSLNIN